jgi:hypothetical protein
MLDTKRDPWNGPEIGRQWGENAPRRAISPPEWDKISAKVLTDPRS